MSISKTETEESTEEDESHIQPIPENVKEDPRLQSCEKELILRTANDQDHFTLDVNQAGVIRRAMRHPHIEIQGHNVHQGSITGARATLPRGLVLLKGKPRKASGPASIIAQSGLKDTNGGD
jgi:hypothetical protein